MDLSSIISIIGSLGFPIVACIAMFYYMTKITEAHKEEVTKITEALNNNTIALTRLESKIGEQYDGK